MIIIIAKLALPLVPNDLIQEDLDQFDVIFNVDEVSPFLTAIS